MVRKKTKIFKGNDTKALEWLKKKKESEKKSKKEDKKKGDK